MHLNLIAIGKTMPAWVQTGFQDYSKRFPLDFRFQLFEIEPAKRTKNADIPRILQDEGERMLTIIPKNSRIIALEINGNLWNTDTLAKNFQTWEIEGRPLSFLIGGPEGLAPSCIKVAELSWSLSPLTFPHPLVRIMVVEQLYRAISLLKGHPYHR